MIPIVEPAALYAPVTVGLAWLGVLATAGTVAIAAMVAWAARPSPRLRATIVALPRRLSRAA